MALRRSSQFVDYVAKFWREFLERKGAVRLVSICLVFVEMSVAAYTDCWSSCTVRRIAIFFLVPEWGRWRRIRRCVSSAFFCSM